MSNTCNPMEDARGDAHGSVAADSDPTGRTRPLLRAPALDRSRVLVRNTHGHC